jgi:hypothetical protein
MPYRNQWFDAPKDTSLIVHKELPEGVEVDRLSFIHNLREASGYVNGRYTFFTFCKRCGGWIEGHANEYEVNTLNSSRLSGRRGTEYHCCRCGEQIAFMGMMS